MATATISFEAPLLKYAWIRFLSAAFFGRVSLRDGMFFS